MKRAENTRKTPGRKEDFTMTQEACPSVWERLAAEQRPILLYGMGDGADKILAQFAARGIQAAGVFASDDFVRGHSFHGFPVRTLRDTLSVFGDDIVIVVAFATQRPEVMQRIADLDARFPVVVPDVPVVVEPPGACDRSASSEPSGDFTPAVGSTDFVSPTDSVGSVPFEVFTPTFARAHRDELEQVYTLLADEQSRVTFANLIRFKLTGALSYLRASTTPLEEVPALLELGADEHFADLGAYTGDTIRAFLRATGGAFGSITALEPDRRNFRKLVQYVQDNLTDRACLVHPANPANSAHSTVSTTPADSTTPLGSTAPGNPVGWNAPSHRLSVRLVQAGAWERDTTLLFAAKAGRQSRLVADTATAARSVPTPMRSLDSLYARAPCTLIKMDVEGAEREALQGARQVIARCQPKLAIAVYHRNADLFTLPLLVHSLCPAYRLYLRHHPYIPAWDTNLYAVVKKAGNAAFSGV